MLSLNAIRNYFAICLLAAALSSIFAGCASTQEAHPAPVKFDADWQFADFAFEEQPRACLKQGDIEKLNQILIRCGAHVK